METDPLLYFPNFLHRAFGRIGIGEPTRLQYWVADKMQNGPDRLVFVCFRGFGKSTLAQIRGCHVGYCDVERKFFVVSASATRSEDATTFMLSLATKMPETQSLVPDPTRGQRQSRIAFDWNGAAPAAAPSVRSLGIMSNGLFGQRATDILADDCETKENTVTPGNHEKVIDRCRELGGAILRSKIEVSHPKSHFLGTPQLEGSMYFSHLEAAGYEVVIIPARYPTSEQLPLYHGRVAEILMKDLEDDPSLAGKPTEPTRFDEAELIERELEYGPVGWQLQFMLLPTLSDTSRYTLKLNDLIVMDCDKDVAPEKVLYTSEKDYRCGSELPRVGFENDYYHRPKTTYGEHVPYERAIMAVDPSSGGRDELAYVIIKVLNSQVFLLDAGGFREGDNEDTLRTLAYNCREYGVTTLVYEKNYGGGMFGKLIRPHLNKFCPEAGVEEVHVSGKKEVRISEILGPVTRHHRLIVHKDLIAKDFDSTKNYPEAQRGGAKSYQLFHQMSRLTQQSKCLVHDDRLDALSLGVQWITESMSLDYKEQIEARKEAEFDEMLEQWDKWHREGINGARRNPGLDRQSWLIR